MTRFFGTLLLKRAVRIWLVVLVAAFVLYTTTGFWLVPRIVRSQLLGFASDNYHRQASVGEIRFNPFTLVLETRSFSFPDADGSPLFGFDRLMLDFDVSSIWKRGASFAAVEVGSPFVHALVRKEIGRAHV